MWRGPDWPCVARVTDDELLRMLQQVEDVEAEVLSAPVSEEPLPSMRPPEADPCATCGEPAEHTGECHVCGTEGCLPPDLWSPGMGEPCLTLCVRCARTIHVGCAGEDGAGNPTCPRCKY